MASVTDRIQRSMQWLADKQRGSATEDAQVGQLVTYRRGATTASVVATLGKTGFRAENVLTKQTQLEWSDADFVFTVAHLEAQGITMPPERNDAICYGGQNYVLMHINGEQPYKFDGFVPPIEVRVHTKRSG